MEASGQELATREVRKVRQIDYVEDLAIALIVTEAYRFGARQKELIATGKIDETQARKDIRRHVMVADSVHNLTMKQRNHVGLIAMVAAEFVELA